MYTEKVSIHGKGTGPSGLYIYSWLPGSLEKGSTHTEFNVQTLKFKGQISRAGNIFILTLCEAAEWLLLSDP